MVEFAIFSSMVCRLLASSLLTGSHRVLLLVFFLSNSGFVKQNEAVCQTGFVVPVCLWAKT